jgi:hypothetical protein
VTTDERDTPNEQLDERIARLKRLNVQRVQRCRKRKVNGGCIFTVDLSGEDVAQLIKAGMLAEDKRHDPAAVRTAILSAVGLRSESLAQAASGQHQASPADKNPPSWFPDRCNQCLRFAGRLEAFPVNGQKVLFHPQCWPIWREARAPTLASGAREKLLFRS